MLHFFRTQRSSNQTQAGDRPAEVMPIRIWHKDRGYLQNWTHASQIKFADSYLQTVAVKAELFPVKGRSQEMPFAGGQRSRAGQAVVLAHPQSRVLGIERKIA